MRFTGLKLKILLVWVFLSKKFENRFTVQFMNIISFFLMKTLGIFNIEVFIKKIL